jgi:hypothetical protein
LNIQKVTLQSKDSGYIMNIFKYWGIFREEKAVKNSHGSSGICAFRRARRGAQEREQKTQEYKPGKLNEGSSYRQEWNIQSFESDTRRQSQIAV